MRHSLFLMCVLSVYSFSVIFCGDIYSFLDLRKYGKFEVQFWQHSNILGGGGLKLYWSDKAPLAPAVVHTYGLRLPKDLSTLIITVFF